MDDWDNINETSLPRKEDFYINMEDITGANYTHRKRVCKDFETKNKQKKKIGKYYDLYAQSNTSLLADVFNNFWNTCLEIYELNPARFVTAPGLPRSAALKTTKWN